MDDNHQSSSGPSKSILFHTEPIRESWMWDSHTLLGPPITTSHSALSQSQSGSISIFSTLPLKTWLVPNQAGNNMSTLSHSSEETMTGPNSTEPENQTISQNALDVEASGYQKSSMPEAQMANDLVPAASAVGGHGGGPGGKPKLDKFAYSCERLPHGMLVYVADGV